MLRRTPSKDAALRLFIYDARRGTTESTEKEKLLAFYPTAVNIDEQLSTVGLAQTFALFTGTFSGDSSFISLDTDKCKWAVRNFEPGVWLGIVVKKDWGPGRAGSGGCKRFLEDMYSYLVLLHGSVQRLLDLDTTGRRARASLQGIIEIWGNLMTRKKSEERAKYENPLSLRRLGAIPTLVLTRSAYLTLQSLVNALRGLNVGPGCQVERVLVCHDAYLLSSDLNGKNTYQLYSFVEKNGMLAEGKGLERGATLIHVNEDDSMRPFWLMPIYKPPLSMFLVLDANPQSTVEFDALTKSMQNDAASLVKSASFQSNSLRDYHIAGYRYANVDRLAHLGYATPAVKIKTLSDKTLQLLTQVQNKVDEHYLATEDSGDFETVLKGENGAWIINKKAGSKMLYVALDIVEDFSPGEVDEYVNRMCHRHFPGSFEM